MQKLTFFLILMLVILVQVAWGPWLSFWGFSPPLSSILLLFGIKKGFDGKTLLIFAFLAGLFYDLLGSKALGAMALVNLIVVSGGRMVFKQFKIRERI